tara:strand:+ start:377 stop:1207 length:831 start_codon:yes stop_codon:yes gene_type:complete
MAWFDETWPYRQPLTFANHGGVSAPEGQITIPAAFGAFWEQVQSDFKDVRITAADGVTLLDWAFHGGTPSQANRTATIQIDQTNHDVATLYGNAAASASVGAFLYWGNEANNLASGANNSINITTTPKAVSVDLTNPTSSTLDHIFKCYKTQPDISYPKFRIRKQVSDSIKIYWDLSGCVTKLRRNNQASVRDEEIAYVKAIIYDQDGADTTSAMTVLNDIKIGPDYVVSMPLKAGDHEKRYIIIMTFGLVNHQGDVRVFDQRATVLVNNLGLHPS